MRALVAVLALSGCYDLGMLTDRFGGDAAVADLSVTDPGDLAGADLTGADLAGADLANADLARPFDLGPTPDLGGKRVMFLLTPDRYGNVLSAAGNLTMLDMQCTTAANNASIAGTFVALIATASIPATRGLTFSTARPIVLPSGTLVSDGLLFSAPIVHKIDEQANRTPLPGTSTCVWTGFNASGVSTSYNCADWTVGQGTPNYQGTVGDTRFATNAWAQAVENVCNIPTCFVYCLQQ